MTAATEHKTVRVQVPVLARVEGEGALDLVVRDGRIEDIRLRIYEPPRLFEQMLVGRDHREIPDLVARICGICPVAYQMSGVHAVERLFGCDPRPWVRRMRRLFYCGEWIQSHALHIHLLAAPDFLGFESAPAMAARYGDEVRRGLRLQGVGNRIIRLFGARSVHPVGARVGGFWKAPDRREVAALAEEVDQVIREAEALLGWTASLPLPENPQPFTCVALRHPDEYPMIADHIVSEGGLNIAVDEFEQYFTESQVAHSTALHGRHKGLPYLVGPLARLNLNLDRLHPQVRDALGRTGIRFPSHDMYHSIVARAAEILQSLLEASEILADYVPQDPAYLSPAPRAGIGCGASEAPRGLLWHRYTLDLRGQIEAARIVPPTSQNQARIEEDLRLSLTSLGLDKDEDTLRHAGEMVIRNYDPCISCATHFLRLNLTR
ncbi:MAG: nickel-dependent hydrogenase large subunit [Chromatiaceae bacterium]|jgi:coenzyme F420-reducing hydrogenase alpha subunit|nr:nickel-dependent hydrogenase large subunit [Chromatiaceae bacterium]